MAVSPEIIKVRRRALANQFRATQGRLRSIQESDLFSSIEADKRFMDEKELAAVAAVSEGLHKLEKHLGSVSRRLEG